jgi:hypothetical protein
MDEQVCKLLSDSSFMSLYFVYTLNRMTPCFVRCFMDGHRSEIDRIVIVNLITLLGNFLCCIDLDFHLPYSWVWFISQNFCVI